MFSICDTVCMIWFWYAESIMARSLRAILIHRWLELKPKPCNRCWRTCKRKLSARLGLTVLKSELDVMRLLLKPTVIRVPVGNPWVYPKLYVLVFCTRVEVPVKMMFDCRSEER